MRFEDDRNWALGMRTDPTCMSAVDGRRRGPTRTCPLGPLLLLLYAHAAPWTDQAAYAPTSPRSLLFTLPTTSSLPYRLSALRMSTTCRRAPHVHRIRSACPLRMSAPHVRSASLRMSAPHVRSAPALGAPHVHHMSTSTTGRLLHTAEMELTYAYLSAAELEARLRAVAASCGGRATVVDVGASVQGRPLTAVKLSNAVAESKRQAHEHEEEEEEEEEVLSDEEKGKEEEEKEEEEEEEEASSDEEKGEEEEEEIERDVEEIEEIERDIEEIQHEIEEIEREDEKVGAAEESVRAAQDNARANSENALSATAKASDEDARAQLHANRANLLNRQAEIHADDAGDAGAEEGATSALSGGKRNVDVKRERAPRRRRAAQRAASVPRTRPAVKLVANMHGDEVVGRQLLLNLLEKMCGADGGDEDPRVALVRDNIDLYLLPSMNPDGLEAYRLTGDVKHVRVRAAAIRGMPLHAWSPNTRVPLLVPTLSLLVPSFLLRADATAQQRQRHRPQPQLPRAQPRRRRQRQGPGARDGRLDDVDPLAAVDALGQPARRRPRRQLPVGRQAKYAFALWTHGAAWQLGVLTRAPFLSKPASEPARLNPRVRTDIRTRVRTRVRTCV